MTPGETLYLALVLFTIGGFGLWLFYVNWRYDRLRGGKPEAKRQEELPHGMAPAGAD